MVNGVMFSIGKGKDFGTRRTVHSDYRSLTTLFFPLFPTGSEDARQLACNVCEELLVIADGDE